MRFTRWRLRRFFALLAETGNVRMACEISGVGLGCIYRLRRTEPGFVALMEAAVGSADCSLGHSKRKDPHPPIAGAMGPSMPRSPCPPDRAEPRGARLTSASLKGRGALEDEGWAGGAPPAEEDVVIRRGIGGRLRVMAAGTRWWSARHDAIFLGHLRATGNVRQAARAAGFTAKTAYNRRDRLESFARAWDAALDESGPRIEDRLRGEAMKGTWGMEDGLYAPAEPERFDFDQALRYLTWRERRARRQRRGTR